MTRRRPGQAGDRARRLTASRGCEPDRDERGHACDDECERRPAELREPSGEEATDRRESDEGEEVEPDEAPAEVVRGAELDERVRVCREEREGDADREQDEPCENRAMYRSEHDGEHAEGGGAGCEEPPARFPEARGDERADERPASEGGREEAEAFGPDVHRVRGEQRHEDVEVEADGAHDRHDAEHKP